MDEGVPVAGRPEDDGELAALRRRAYSADADIADDPAALARLAELEDLARLSRARDADPLEVESDGASASASTATTATVVGPAAPAAPAARFPPRPRWHTALVAGTAVVAVVLGAAVWSERTIPVAAPDPRIAAVAALPGVHHMPSTSSAEGYREFLDSLREDVLAGADPDLVAGRIIRDELRPYGGMNGRQVWAGPTIDGALCLVVSDVEAPVIACANPATVKARGISIVLPAGRADSAAESVFPPGQSIRYTLGPGMSVSTQPAVD